MKMLNRVLAAILLTVALAPLSTRADSTIDGLGACGGLTGAESVPMFQTANPACKASTLNIASLFLSHPPGTNGQVPYNNSGVFGAFTFSGDATLVPSTGVLTVTKTGGVAFAASATTDTTNAVNITSGALPAARMPALTGDVTSSAGSIATTLATVNSNVGSFTNANITVNAKGLITAAATGSGGSTVPGGTSGQVQYNNAGAFGGFTLSGDATLVPSTGVITVTKTNGSSFVASATTDTTNAANISSGTLPATRLPNPSATTLGGVESLAAVTHDFLTSISVLGVPTQAQPNYTDLAGSVPAITALTGDVTASGSGSQAATLAATAVTAGSYTNANITVDAKGRLTSAANGSGSGVSVTAATPNVVVTPSPGTGTFTVGTTSPINAQVGTSYTILTGDNTKLLTTSNASAIALTLPQAGTTGFLSGWAACLNDVNTGAATVTTTTSIILGGGSTLFMPKGVGACLASDGSNYDGILGVPPYPNNTTTSLRGDGTWAAVSLTAGVNGILPVANGGTGASSPALVAGTNITITGSWPNQTINAAGGGSGCSTAGSIHNVLTDNGSGGCSSDANANLTAGALSLGASGTAGSVVLGNASSGTVTIAPVTGALGSVTASLPANTGTIAELNLAQTFTASQRGQVNTITISTATFTPNFDTAQNQSMTLIHASCPCTLANPSTTPVAGQSGMFVITQSSTGSDTIGTWGSQYLYAGGTSTITLSTGVSAVDYLPYYVADATHIVLGGIVKGPTH